MQTYRLKVNGWEKMRQAKSKHNKITQKKYFKTSRVTRDQEGSFIIIQGSVYGEDTAILSVTQITRG